jgi:hypothetical protein
MRCVAATRQLNGKGPAAAASHHEAVARLAYEFWLSRGRPVGTAEEDWRRAEEEVRKRARMPALTEKSGYAVKSGNPVRRRLIKTWPALGQGRVNRLQ